MNSQTQDEIRSISRRAILKSLGLAPLFLRAAPFYGSPVPNGPVPISLDQKPLGFPFSDVRLTPRYPTQSPLADVLRLVPPGSDAYITEKYASEIEQILKEWSRVLKASISDNAALRSFLDQESRLPHSFRIKRPKCVLDMASRS